MAVCLGYVVGHWLHGQYGPTALLQKTVFDGREAMEGLDARLRSLPYLHRIDLVQRFDDW